MHDMPAILTAILPGYALPVRCHHGLAHWARVLENGWRIAASNGADRDVVGLFALFHDARRVNESRDDGHGLRGAELARSLRGTLVHLDDARFDLLFEACRLHTDGLDGRRSDAAGLLGRRPLGSGAGGDHSTAPTLVHGCGARAVGVGKWTRPRRLPAGGSARRLGTGKGPPHHEPRPGRATRSPTSR